MGQRAWLGGCAVVVCAGAGAAHGQQDSVLVFTKTAGFRHDCIPAAATAVERLGRQRCFSITRTEDGASFTPGSLAQYDAVIFLCTTGDVLNGEQEAAMEAFVRGGGGFVGVHSAADTEFGWPFYGELVGARFANHPAIQAATVRIERADHPSTAMLPNPWTRTDEWYNFASNPRANVQVLATVDESTYSGGTMGTDHPIAWCHVVDLGRSWYTAMGHSAGNYSDPVFLEHLSGGILWALGRDALAPCTVDQNCDGLVDPDDLADFIACFFENAGGGAVCAAADFNRDGGADPDDLADYIAAFFAGC